MVEGMDAALFAATNRLEGRTETPRLDAELLMAHALRLSRGEMLLKRRDLTKPAEFDALIARRADGEPVAYIRGVQEFWDLTLKVTPDVLIPRADSETVIEAAQSHFAGRGHPTKILDLGTGSGALLLAALSLFPEAEGIGIDASAAALAVAMDNAVTCGFGKRSAFMHASWREPGWAEALGPFDLILCNPPYVEVDAKLDRSVRAFEPASALFSGSQGLDDYRILIPQIPALLSPQGAAIFEIGMGQEGAVSALAREAGFSVNYRADLGGIIRALTFTWER
jgi:release factor glutamine methyltransferase